MTVKKISHRTSFEVFIKNRQAVVKMDKQQKTIIHWFRKGLRIHDNPGNSIYCKLNLISCLLLQFNFTFKRFETLSDKAFLSSDPTHKI